MSVVRGAKLPIGLGVAAFLALVIAANWQFVTLALASHPGCVQVDPEHAAAKPGC
ncbi:hypothetical protein [Maliponia aquimaris]|uniref:Uncharacterized protein n=1 Tax=Maliponia aquimaris TaxID=1673631 RepID=A0A238L2Y5_9RHOB|nr:hypothetical protein [Maliponia aquimaris]SMX48792.1 hypothetical protein MAA8898_04101 [Maliponia aquimaris]